MKSKESPLKRINRVIAGIYKITSPDGKIYIGQSINLKRRMRSYFIKSNAMNHRRLKESFIKFGKENHFFEIVLECQEYELNEKERFYQDYYDCIGANDYCGVHGLKKETFRYKIRTNKIKNLFIS